jgi:ATP-dependent Clp protease protease subunit
MNVAIAEFNRANETIFGILSQHTGHSVEKVRKDCDRDYWLSSQEALEYHIVDKVLEPGSR